MMDFLLQNVFEFVEYILSYMSNTVSFLRVGAFVLVHAGMMMVVFSLAGANEKYRGHRARKHSCYRFGRPFDRHSGAPFGILRNVQPLLHRRRTQVYAGAREENPKKIKIPQKYVTMKGIIIMTTFILCTLFVLIPALLLYSAVIAFKRMSSGKSPKKALRFNIGVFAALICAVALTSVSVFAAPETEEPATTAEAAETASAENDGDMSKGMGLLAAGIVTGLAGIGGGIAVAAGAPAAIAATSEDPKSFGKSIIFVALGESIALYGVVIAILILQKV